ncbi:AMED_5909 family protein [Allokutzneria sp. NRRL B-24872]|uniref:AMED_5909 family protein n=1 Tax=Allokutzneria sp. NRRL B-24872 TaxID=1137961 RepID=UPI000A35EC0D|nr:AMED_5909 family protein [Allokutzneria sp. NRRL B-24872]
MRHRDGWAVAMRSRTLREARETLLRLRPAPHARPSEWHTYHRQTVEVYAQVAEVDTDHRHEALYWVSHVRQKLADVERSLPRQRR